MVGRPIILIHGWTMRGTAFDPLLTRLKHGGASLAPDLPGHGRMADAPIGLDACARFLARQIEALDTAPILVGWSMGAAVAWRYIEQSGPSHLAGVVTVEMSPRLPNDAGWAHGLTGQNAESLLRTTREIHEDWTRAAEKIATTMFADRTGAAAFSRDAALAQILSNDPARMATYWDEMIAMDARPVIPRIDCPCIAAFGARSRVYPASAARWIAETAPHGRTVAFSNSGHSPHLEEPEAFARLLREFEAELAD